MKRVMLFVFGALGFLSAIALACMAVYAGWLTLYSTPNVWIGCVLSVAFLIAGSCLMTEAYNCDKENGEKNK